MRPSDRARAAELFHELVELDAGGRAERLKEIARGEPLVAGELESLLRAHDTEGALDQLVAGASQVFADPPDAGWSRAASASPDDLSDTSVAHYEIGELIGRGGMGDVYRARDTRLNRDVALKFLPEWLSRDPGARDRFLVEARVVSSLDHPNVCRLHDIGETEDGRLYLIMQYYAGQTLRARLEHGALPPEEAVEIALQAARGVAAAHEGGVIHRDVKPANLLLTGAGKLKILDFGVAKLADVHLTQTGQTPGTASYMSPEQRTGGEVDARSDLWSLGAVLYEMLTGSRPAGESSVAAGLTRVPGVLAEVVTRLLAESPADRYPDARSLAEDLAVLADGTGALRARPAPSVKRFLAELKRRHVFRVAAVYGAIGFAVIEAADAMFVRLALPDWTVTLVVWLIVLGFPVALVLAWAFEATPGGVRRTRSVRPAILDAIAAQPASRRWPIGVAGAVGGALLVVAAWYALGDLRNGRDGPTLADGSFEAPLTIAVVAAASSDEDDQGEGLAGLLARGLDDVEGLRAAPANLVLRSWRARDEVTADSAAAVSVARSVDASAAIVFSATSIGTALRLYARVHPVSPSEGRGSVVSVEGHQEELVELVDELAVLLVAQLLPDQRYQRASIAAISTRSLPAMQAFILGEEAMRRSEYGEAVPHFLQAVEEDTAFALAWHRLQTAYGWTGELEEGEEAGVQAARHAAQLPERERLIVEAYSNYPAERGEVLGEVEDAVRRRPDDWELMELLSEIQLHAGGYAGISPRTVDSVRALAAALAPENAVLLKHGIDLALGFHRDSALALRRIAQMEEITGRREDDYRLTLDLVFARDEGPGEAARLSATPDDLFADYPFRLTHPLSTPARIRVNRAIADRDVMWRILEPKFFTEVTQGRLGEAFEALEVVAPNAPYAPRSRACHAYLLHAAGVEVGGTNAARWLSAPTPGATDDTGGEATAETMLCLGGLAVDEQRWEDAEAWFARIRAAIPTDDPAAARAQSAAAAALDAYLGWARGASGEPIPRSVRLDTYAGASWPIRWWTARMLAEAGQRQDALEVYESFWLPAWVPAFLRRAEVSEELGRTAAARELYTVVTTIWADADPAFEPLLERARAGLARLDEAATATAPPVADVP